MKKITMVATLSLLALGAFAQIDKPKKHKKSEHCCQQCTPECKAHGCCDKSHCTKA